MAAFFFRSTARVGAPHSCGGGALQRSATIRATLSRALALGLQGPVAKATIFARCLLRWTKVQLPQLKQRALTGKAFSSTGNPVYPEK
jgi:hypothetical protein